MKKEWAVFKILFSLLVFVISTLEMQGQNWRTAEKKLQSPAWRHVDSLLEKGDFSSALALAESQAEQAKTLETKLLWAVAKAQAFVELGKTQEASQSLVFLDSLPSQLSPVAQKLRADGLYYRGTSAVLLGQAPQALSFHKKALEIREGLRPQDWEDLANSHSFVGYVYRDELSNVSAAEPHYLQAATLRESNGKLSAELLVEYFNLGAVYRQLGDVEKAQVFFEKVLESSGRMEDSPHNFEGYCLNGLGSLFYDQDRYETAEYYFKQSLRSRIAAGDPADLIANSYYNLANALMGQDNDSALYYLKKGQALEAAAPQQDSSGIWESYIQLGLAQQNQAGYANMRKMLALSRRLFPEEGDLNHQRSLYCMGIWHKNVDKKDSALYYFNEALHPSFKKSKGRFYTINTLAERASLLTDIGTQENSPGHLLRALKDFQELEKLKTLERQKVDGEPGKFLHSDLNFKVFVSALKAAHGLYRYDEYREKALEAAWYFMECSKAANLMEALAESQVRDQSPEASVLFYELQNVESARASQQKNLTTDETRAAANQAIFDLDRRHDSLEILLKGIVPQTPDAEVVSRQETEDFLGSETSLLSYFEGDSAIFIIAVSDGNWQFAKIPAAPAKKHLRIFARHLSQGFSEGTASADFMEFQNSAHWLYQNLVAIVKPKGKDCIIIPDGGLAQVPFEAFVVEKSPTPEVNYRNLVYLISGPKMRYAFSASWFISSLPILKKMDAKCALSAFSYGRDAHSDNHLPHSQKEVDAIQKLWRGDFRGYSGHAATKPQFSEALQNAQVVHVAFHNVYNTFNPYESGLVFPSQNEQKNEAELLYMHEMYRLQSQAKLVVLSACKSGYGEALRGQGIFSIGRGFAYMGVPTTVASLWRVSDQKCAAFFSDFYEGVSAEKPVSSALADAKLHYLENADEYGAHPNNWAGFVQIGGDPALTVQNRQPRPVWPWLLGGGAAVLLFFGLRRVIPWR